VKLLLAITGTVALFAFIFWGIGSYLGPDDLKDCGARPSAEAGCQKADAIVAISGGDTVARTAEAIKLYKNGWADNLIFSGAAMDPQSQSNAKAMLEQALDAGVPAGDITLEEFAQNTEQNAVHTTELVDPHTSRIILVTSAYHQRRASMEFESAFRGIEIVNHPVAHDKHWSRLWWATPVGWWLTTSEMIKILFISSKG
jgi:uncharacterized SAM-binding protein YcdF (DUF218 family)